jgi:hypothetical protein
MCENLHLKTQPYKKIHYCLLSLDSLSLEFVLVVAVHFLHHLLYLAILVLSKKILHTHLVNECLFRSRTTPL